MFINQRKCNTQKTQCFWCKKGIYFTHQIGFLNICTHENIKNSCLTCVRQTNDNYLYTQLQRNILEYIKKELLKHGLIYRSIEVSWFLFHSACLLDFWPRHVYWEKTNQKFYEFTILILHACWLEWPYFNTYISWDLFFFYPGGGPEFGPHHHRRRLLPVQCCGHHPPTGLLFLIWRIFIVILRDGEDKICTSSNRNLISIKSLRVSK